MPYSVDIAGWRPCGSGLIRPHPSPACMSVCLQYLNTVPARPVARCLRARHRQARGLHHHLAAVQSRESQQRRLHRQRSAPLVLPRRRPRQVTESSLPRTRRAKVSGQCRREVALAAHLLDPLLRTPSTRGWKFCLATSRRRPYGSYMAPSSFLVRFLLASSALLPFIVLLSPFTCFRLPPVRKLLPVHSHYTTNTLVQEEVHMYCLPPTSSKESQQSQTHREVFPSKSSSTHQITRTT